MVKIFTTEDVRAHLLSEMELTEEKLGTAALAVKESHADQVWSWCYSDSMTHDWGVVTVDEKDELDITLNPESASYSEGWTPND